MKVYEANFIGRWLKYDTEGEYYAIATYVQGETKEDAKKTLESLYEIHDELEIK